MLNIDPTLEYVLLYDYQNIRPGKLMPDFNDGVEVPKGTVVTVAVEKRNSTGHPYGPEFHLVFTVKATGRKYWTIMPSLFALNTPENVERIEYLSRLEEIRKAAIRMCSSSRKAVTLIDVTIQELYNNPR